MRLNHSLYPHAAPWRFAYGHSHGRSRGSIGLWLLLAVLLLGGLAAYGAWLLRQPVAFAPDVQGPRVTVEIPRGSSPGQMVRILQKAGVQVPTWPTRLWLRAHVGQLKAGFYQIPRGASVLAIAKKLREGEQTLLSVTIPEGWNLRQVRARIDGLAWLRHDTAGWSDAELAQKIGLAAGLPLEGQLAPDTYRYAPGSSDLVFYRQAAAHMQKNLAAAWAQRSASAQVRSPQEALILASIIEKETGHGADRGLISGVFNNRLRIGMALQTDPTVIYGMGAAYRGNIRKVDLQTDTPYNTYTRPGLPPGPIAMPGQAALLAAVQPAQTKALYFVAKGDGSGQSQFSASLDEHNRAVRKHILRR